MNLQVQNGGPGSGLLWLKGSGMWDYMFTPMFLERDPKDTLLGRQTAASREEEALSQARRSVLRNAIQINSVSPFQVRPWVDSSPS